MKTRKVLAGLATAGLVAVGITVGGAAPASAGCATEIGSSSMTPVVVGTSAVVTSTFTFKVNDCGEDAEPFYTGADFYHDPSGWEYAANIVQRSHVGDTYTFSGTTRWDPRFMYNEEAGTWKPLVNAYGSTQDEEYTNTFRVQRRAVTTTNATPEPIAKGRTLTVRGTLKRANWDTGRYAGYGSQKATLQFRTPTGAYANVKNVTSSSSGDLKTTVTARKDGCYRYVYAGHSTTSGAISVGDCVNVT